MNTIFIKTCCCTKIFQVVQEFSFLSLKENQLYLALLPGIIMVMKVPVSQLRVEMKPLCPARFKPLYYSVFVSPYV